MATKTDLLNSEFKSTLGEQIEIARKIGRTQGRVDRIKNRLEFLIKVNDMELQRSFDSEVEDSLRRAIELCKTIMEDLETPIY